MTEHDPGPDPLRFARAWMLVGASGVFVGLLVGGLPVVWVGLPGFDATGVAWAGGWLIVTFTALGCVVVFARTPTPMATGMRTWPQGLSADGPERRRVRQALRDGTPMRPTDRQRAIDRLRGPDVAQETQNRWARWARWLMVVIALVMLSQATLPRLDGRPLLLSDGVLGWSHLVLALLASASLALAILWPTVVRSRHQERLARLEAHPTA